MRGKSRIKQVHTHKLKLSRDTPKNEDMPISGDTIGDVCLADDSWMQKLLNAMLGLVSMTS